MDIDAETWARIAAITQKLDRNSVLPAEQERFARVLKIGEENGEVVDAFLGALGQNPRKGITNGFDRVGEELTDVVITTLVAMYTVLGEAAPAAFAAAFERVTARTLNLPEPVAAASST
jgi:hypothetical protein